MDDLYLKHVGRETQLKERMQALETELRAVRDSIHLKTDPLADLTDIDGVDIANLGMRLATLTGDYLEARLGLKAVQRALGRQEQR